MTAPKRYAWLRRRVAVVGLLAGVGVVMAVLGGWVLTEEEKKRSQNETAPPKNGDGMSLPPLFESSPPTPTPSVAPSNTRPAATTSIANKGPFHQSPSLSQRRGSAFSQSPPQQRPAFDQDLLLKVPLHKPLVWRVPPTGGSPPVVEHRDLVLLPNKEGLPVLRPVVIKGYRNVLVANLVIAPLRPKEATTSAPAALTFVRTTPGIVAIASTTIDTTRFDGGGIFIEAPQEAAPTRILIASSSLRVRDTSRRRGAFSWRGALHRIEVRDSLIESDNVGLRLAPQRPHDYLEDALLRNVKLRRTHTRLEQAHLLEVWSPYGTVLRHIVLRNVRVETQKAVPLGELVYPGHTTAPPSPTSPPIALEQIYTPKGTWGVWNFPNIAGEAAVVGPVRYAP